MYVSPVFAIGVDEWLEVRIIGLDIKNVQIILNMLFVIHLYNIVVLVDLINFKKYREYGIVISLIQS